MIGEVIVGDNIEVLKKYPDNYFSAVLTDPPYGLGEEPDANEVLKDWLEKGYHEVKNKGGFMGKCYHKDTEVLTKTGWKNISKIKEGDILMSLNENRKIEIAKVHKTYSYQYDGELIHIKHRSSEQCVTPNHNCLILSKAKNNLLLCKADDLPKSFYLLNQAFPNKKRSNPIISFGEKEYSSDKFCYLLGLYLGDGFVTTRKGLRTDNFWGFSVHKQRKVIVIEKAFLNLKIKFTKNIDAKNKKTTFYVYEKKLLSFFKKLGKAEKKHIPRKFLDLGYDSLKNIFNGLIDTDGHVQNGQKTYSTVSKRLADNIQELCLKMGLSCSIAIQKKEGVGLLFNRKTVTKNVYRLCVLQENKRLYVDPRQNNILKVKYSDLVHCVELDKNHVLYTRFNGKPVWSGNSWDAFVPQPLLWKEVFRVLKPGGHMLVACGTRTQDWMCMAIRLAGFEVKDTLTHHYAVGFPKSQNVSVAIDEKLGAERKVVGKNKSNYRANAEKNHKDNVGAFGFKAEGSDLINEAATEEAKKYEGYGTQLKPSTEFYTLARKPLSEKTIAENVMKHGTGGINIDGTRIAFKNEKDKESATYGTGVDITGGNFAGGGHTQTEVKNIEANEKGRWPANTVFSHHEDCVCTGSKKIKAITGGKGEKSHGGMGKNGIYGKYALDRTGDNAGGLGDENGEEEIEQWQCVDGCPVKELNMQSGMTTSGSVNPAGFKGEYKANIYGKYANNIINPSSVYADTGYASRFFFVSKPSQEERNAGLHNFKLTAVAAGNQAKANLKRGNEDYASDSESASGFSSVKKVKNFHPTIKPIKLFRMFAKLIMPPDPEAILLDMYAGSGTTGCACEMEGFRYVLIEKEPDYAELAKARCIHWHKEKRRQQLSLF